VAFVLSPPLMEDTEASRAAKDLFRECVHPTIVVAMVARQAPVTDDRLGGGADGRQLETLHPGSAGPSRINMGARFGLDEASIAGGIRRRAKPKARLFSEMPNEPWLLISHHSTRSDST
jgi:hypothetical protein